MIDVVISLTPTSKIIYSKVSREIVWLETYFLLITRILEDGIIKCEPTFFKQADSFVRMIHICIYIYW